MAHRDALAGTGQQDRGPGAASGVQRRDAVRPRGGRDRNASQRQPGGRVDPQIEVTKQGGEAAAFSAFEELASFLEFSRKEVGLTDQAHIRAMFEVLCNQVGTVPVGVAARVVALVPLDGGRSCCGCT